MTKRDIVTNIKNSQTKIEKRIKPKNRATRVLFSITNFKMIIMFVLNIVNPNNSKPHKCNTHNSKKRFRTNTVKTTDRVNMRKNTIDFYFYI